MTLRGLRVRCREWLSGRRIDQEAAEELRNHVEMLVEQTMASGCDEQEARRRVRLRLGDVSLAQEDLRTGRTGFLVEQTLRDLRFAARSLFHTRGSSLLAIITMAVGIGASTAVFSLLSGIVLRPLPYPQPDQLVAVSMSNQDAGITRAGLASGNINDARRRARTLSGLAGFYTMGRTLALGDEAVVLVTAQVTDDFFHVLRVAPALGQTFAEEDFRRAQFNSAAAPIGADPVVVVSQRLWRQSFGSDPSIIGRTVTLERRPFRVVGVMPDGFAMPDAAVDLWIPWDVSGNRPRDQRYLSGVARLQPNVSMAEAASDLREVSAQLAAEYPDDNKGWQHDLTPLHSNAVGDAASIIWLLFGAVGLVLLLACGNVAMLAIIRGLDRADEARVRLALGASRGALIRGSMLQSGLLALGGGLVGVGLAVSALRMLPLLAPDLPRLGEVALDRSALWFVIAVTCLSALLSGLPQAWEGSRITLAAGRRSTGSRSSRRLRDLLVTGQVAVAVVLLAGSGLLVHSYMNLASADSGVDPRGVLVVPIFLDSQAYNTGDKTREYYRSVFERLRRLPGVEAVGASTTVPGSPLGPDFERPVWADDRPSESASRMAASVRMVTPGFFDVLQVPVVAGRPFDDRDAPTAPRVVMVNATLAERLWPGEPAVGKKIVVDYSTAGTYPYEVVGVTQDFRVRGPRSEARPEVYFPHAQRSYLIMHVVLRAAGDPTTLVPDVRAALKAVDPQKPAQSYRTLDALLGSTYTRDRQVTATLTVFAATATFLAMLGVYGALAQRVRERSREIGIRIALGADARRIASWVGASAIRLLAIGLTIGLVVGTVLSGALRGRLFGVATTDATTMIAVVAVLVIAGGVAALIPAWRATRIAPMTILGGP